MNHRYQHFAWTERPMANKPKRRMTYTALLVWAIGGAVAGYVLAVVLAII